MKKYVVLLVALFVSLVIFIGCGSDESVVSNASPEKIVDFDSGVMFDSAKAGLLLAKPMNSQMIVQMTEPQYIKDLLDRILGVDPDDSSSYKMLYLDEHKEEWRKYYWEVLGRTILGDAKVDEILADCGEDMACHLGQISRAIVSKQDVLGDRPFAFLRPIASLSFIKLGDVNNKGGRTNTRLNIIDAEYFPLWVSSDMFVKR